MVASGTRNPAAMAAVLRPDTARRVSATCEGRLSAGWQQSSRSRSASSLGSVASSGGGATKASAGWAVPTVSSRAARARSERTRSTRRRDAARINQPRG